MKAVTRWLFLVASLAACSKLPTTGDGIVAIEITIPASTTLHQGESITLQARALDQQGNVVTTPIAWFTIDTANVTVDQATGLVTAKLPSGSARIQASAGTLHSSPLTLQLAAAPAPPTIVLPQER